MLRDRTAEAHARVDAAFAHYALRDRDSYAAMLRAHLDALVPLEASLTRRQDQSPLLADWEARRRLPALLADLDALDARPSILEPVATSDASPEAHIAGTLYVLEGSRLGGKFLARQLPSDFPRRYLDADQPSDNWRKLLEKINIVLYDSELRDSAVEAALSAFDVFERSGLKWSMKAK
ncbi:biliverdin-producing heme oxygenase [Sphingosinithalassobacter portus]|uniref:biliverdin-producing heme oxygenase n=1 Tax=Stakelama portus TaxID=2676234 RepID=UPI001EFC99DC|nr:biliverdin-producing heme oxygenase [Sphingosinithalassobacter portus]